MSKVKLNIGYVKLVMDRDTAVKVFAALTDNEVYTYDTDYVKNEEGKSVAVAKIRPMADEITITGVNKEDYAMWKLAGEAK